MLEATAHSTVLGTATTWVGTSKKGLRPLAGDPVGLACSSYASKVQ